MPNNGEPVWIISKYDSHCIDCSIKIKIGERILWQRGYGSLCSRCGNREDALEKRRKEGKE